MNTRQETCPHGLLPWECYYCKSGLPKKGHTLQPAPSAPYNCKVDCIIAESAYGKPAVPPVPDEPRSAEQEVLANEQTKMISEREHRSLQKSYADVWERAETAEAALLSAQKDLREINDLAGSSDESSYVDEGNLAILRKIRNVACSALASPTMDAFNQSVERNKDLLKRLGESGTKGDGK